MTPDTPPPSETPLTDSKQFIPSAWEDDPKNYVVRADFARQLELWNARLKTKVDDLMTENMNLRKNWST